MAIFHLSAKIIGRSAGRSMLAAAAYRSKSKLYDAQLGRSFSYTRRKNVAYCDILVPAGCPAFLGNREQLWNYVQDTEKRKDSQLCRELEIALPHELCRADQIRLLERFLRRCFVSKGIVCDVCIHDNPGNCHAHVLTTMRSVTATGFGPKRRDMNTPDQLKFWREAWELQTNRFLKLRGRKERIDHRSLEAQAADSNMPSHNNNKEVEMADTKPAHRAPKAHSAAPADTQLLTRSTDGRNVIELAAGPMRPEWFDNLFECLELMLKRMCPDNETNVVFDPATRSYALTVDGSPKLLITNERITCPSGSDEEIGLAVEALLSMGYHSVHLRGSQDFKRRAYDEAIRRGFSPEDITGYSAGAATVSSFNGTPSHRPGAPRPVNTRGKL